MSASDPTTRLSLREGFSPFRGRSRWVQIPVFLGGFLTWVLVYAAIMKLTGWDVMASADTVEAIVTRRRAGAVAGIGVGFYFAILWTRAYGGPVLNFLYFVAVLALIPDQVWSLGGGRLEYTYRTSYRLAIVTSEPVRRQMLVYGMPGMFALVASVAYWSRNLVPDQEEALKEHFPRSWLDRPSTDPKDVPRIECVSCGAHVGHGTASCPECGYYPKKSLVTTGLVYFVVGMGLLWIGGGLSAFAIIVVGDLGGALLLLPLAGAALVAYGLWMAVGALRASVERDLDDFTLPVFW